MGTARRWSVGPISIAAAMSVMAAVHPARAQTAVTVIVIDGDAPAGAGGATVTNVFNPRTNGAGAVGFIGELNDGTHFFWQDDAIAWLSTDAATVTLTLSNPLSDAAWPGMSDAGAWVYEPDVDGVDAIWTETGQLVQVGDPAPGFGGVDDVFTFVARASMTPAGAIYFRGEVDVNDDGFSDAAAMYTTPDGTAGAIVPVIGSGSTVGAETVLWVSSTYDVSDDATHQLYEVFFNRGGNNPAAIVVDGAAVMVQGDPVSTIGVEAWGEFDLAAINDDGDFLVTGDTTGAIATDEFIAYNGTIAIRQGDTVGGVGLPGRVLAASINDRGYAAHAWGSINTNTTDHLFFTCDASALASSRRLISAGDTVDTDGDDVADFTVVGLNADNANFPGLDLSEDMFIYFEADLSDGVSEPKDAILRMEVSCCGNAFVDANEDCDDAGETATCNKNCTDAACGDGIVNMTANEDCDDEGESATCDSDCTDAVCGDGTLNTTAGETCDDGNTTPGDGCDASCLDEQPGTGGGGQGGAGQGGAGQGGSAQGGSAQGGSAQGGAAQGGAAQGGAVGSTGPGGAGANANDEGFQVVDAGCGCGTVGTDRRGHASWALVAIGALALRRRRRAGVRQR